MKNICRHKVTATCPIARSPSQTSLNVKSTRDLVQIEAEVAKVKRGLTTEAISNVLFRGNRCSVFNTAEMAQPSFIGSFFVWSERSILQPDGR